MLDLRQPIALHLLRRCLSLFVRCQIFHESTENIFVHHTKLESIIALRSQARVLAGPEIHS